MQSSDQSKFNPEATEEFIGADPNASTTASEERAREATNELMDELAELAGSITNLGKSWWNSDQRKQIEHDLRSGIDSLGASLESSVHQVASSTEAKEVQAKAGEVGEKVSSSKFVTELATALKTGLQSLSQQLDKVAKDIETKSAAEHKAEEETPADPGMHDIPIDPR